MENIKSHSEAFESKSVKNEKDIGFGNLDNTIEDESSSDEESSGKLIQKIFHEIKKRKLTDSTTMESADKEAYVAESGEKSSREETDLYQNQEQDPSIQRLMCDEIMQDSQESFE